MAPALDIRARAITHRPMIEVTIGGAAQPGIPAAVIAAIISALATLITAAFVIYYARRQAALAADKLALETFERRWKNFQVWRTAFTEQYQRIAGSTGDDHAPALRHSPVFMAAQVEARYLFGKDIELSIRAVEAALQSLDERPGRAIDEAGWDLDVAHYNALLRELLHNVEVYLMLDRIGVNPNHVSRSDRVPIKRL